MTIIHSADFARERGELSGVLAVAGMGRLHDRLAKVDGKVVWRLLGGVDKLERPFLRLTVESKVELRCQRCLKAMPFEIAADTVLTQFSDELTLDEAVAQDEDLEGIVIEPALDVEMLVEDEILLALPYAPRHELCEPAGNADKTAGEAKPNPFAVLAKMKTRKAEDSN